MQNDHVTQLMQAAQAGNDEAAAELLPLVYKELRATAASRLRKLPPGVTLQPTALVHEAFIRLVGGQPHDYENRAHFFFAAARAVHDILVEQARRKASLKRGDNFKRVSPVHLDSAIDAPAEDMLALQEALQKLESSHPRKHQLVMLRFFAGLTESECAEILGCDRRTVTRDWRFARAWLHQFLADEEALADPED